VPRREIFSIASPNAILQLFSSEAAAQGQCPNAEVVWPNTASGIYKEKGIHWHERARHGAYLCRKEATAASDRDIGNVQ
jgi:hypothetical protein